MLASQAFTFFTAGYETSSTMMSNALYELALNQKIQDRLREEINQTLAKFGGNLTYENIKEMKYLDKVCKGTSFKKKLNKGKIVRNRNFCSDIINTHYNKSLLKLVAVF